MAGPYYVDPAGSNTSPYDTWAKAATSLQTVADIIAAGEICYCRGTQTITAAIDFDTVGATGTWAAPVKFIGCNASGDVDGTRFILDAASNNCSCIHFNGSQKYLWFINFQCQNSGNAHGVIADTGYTDYMLFVNCRFTANNQWGINSNGYIRYATFKQCMIDTNAGGGVYRPGQNSQFYGCRISDNTGTGVSAVTGGDFIACEFHDNTVLGLSDYGFSLLYGCVFDTSAAAGADAITTYGADGSLYLGVRVTNINDKEIDVSAGNEVFMDYIYTDGVITEGVIPWRIPDKTNTTHIVESGSDSNDGYVTDELNLASGATYRSEAIEIPSS